MSSSILVAIAIVVFISTGDCNPLSLSPLLANLDTAVPTDPSNNCPPGYSQPANSNWNACYKVYSKLVGKDEATDKCHKDRARVATVPNAFVNSYLYSLASQTSADMLLLGIVCSSDNATLCENDDYTPFNYKNFAPGQPWKFGGPVSMFITGRNRQTWGCSDFHDVLPAFACAVTSISATTKRPPGPTNKSPSRCPEGFTEFNSTCYSINNNFGGYQKQEEKCIQTAGGKMATIATMEVNDFLANLVWYSDCPPLTHAISFGLECKNVTFNGDTHDCAWDDGTSFAYSNFDTLTGEPKKYNEVHSDCVYLLRGRWYTCDCNGMLPCGACEAPIKLN